MFLCGSEVCENDESKCKRVEVNIHHYRRVILKLQVPVNYFIFKNTVLLQPDSFKNLINTAYFLK